MTTKYILSDPGNRVNLGNSEIKKNNTILSFPGDGTDRNIKTMKVVNRGHEAFKNGFTARKR